MLYAILMYHEEGVVESWAKEEDAALMAELPAGTSLEAREEAPLRTAKLARFRPTKTT
jgi:hypothetical protein